MKPEAWATLKAFQRAGRAPTPLGNGAHIDKLRQRLGMQPRYTDLHSSRKPARRARVKGK